jgi:outer membrane protein
MPLHTRPHGQSMPLAAISLAFNAALGAATLGAALLPCEAAHAQAFDAVRLYSARPGQDGGMYGAVVLSVPQYSGAATQRLMLLPVLEYQWRDGWFAGVGNGVGKNFSSNPAQQYGLRLTADLGRDENRSPALKGMGDVAPALEFGGFYNQYLSKEVFLTSSLRYGSGAQKRGLQVDLGAGYSKPLNDTFRVAVGGASTWLNGSSMQSFFGVTPDQARLTGYRNTPSQAGWRDLRINASVSARLGSNLNATLGASLSRLQGQAQDSPLSRKDTNRSLVLAVTSYF